MRVEWVHPSWRDLVIEHLASDPDARTRFLTSCGPNGILLALSLSGGAQGERRLPLLVRDADWDALTDRIYHLIPELELQELTAVLDSIADAISDVGEPAEREPCALARTVLERVGSLWDESGVPVPLPGLESWLALADGLPSFPPRPELPDMDRTWASLLPVSAPTLRDWAGLERFADWLTLAELLLPQRPDYLARCDGRVEIVNTFVDSLDEVRGRISPAVRDDVRRALARIETLGPQLSNPGDYFARMAAYFRRFLASTDPGPSSVHGYRPRESDAPSWRTFDVARVLEDL